MKISDIIVEYRQQDKGLAAFRQFKQGPNHATPDEFSNDSVELPTTTNNTGREQRRSTSTAIPNVSWKVKPKTKQPDLVKQQQYVERVKGLYNQVGPAIEQKGRIPFYSQYGDNTFGCGTRTNNGVKIGIGTQSGPFTELGYVMDNVPKNEGKETIRSAMNEAGYNSVQTKTKLRFKPKSQNIDDIINDFWNVIEIVESLGPDFKKSNRSGTGAGSLITGKQAPWQYYLWIANNIYESVKQNTDWGFSRGGGDGAYDRYDDLIVIGITKGGIEQIGSGRPAYREHVVPSDLINRMGIEICRKYPKTQKYKNQVIKEVALMVHRNLAIVLCSSPAQDSNGKMLRDPKNPTEQEIIDDIKGLRTVMPDDWKDGDSILARFTYCGIPVYKNKKNDDGSNGKRMAE
jgi:hypothetical protein